MGKRDLERGPLPFLVLALLIGATFAQSLSSQFIWDDWIYVVGNPLLKTPDVFWRIWIQRESVDFWPVSWSLYAGLWRLFGSAPLGYHALNLILHFANAVLLFMLVRFFQPRLALFVSALFAVHPLAVDSVVWIFQIKTTLALFFGLLALIFYARLERESRPRALVFSVLFFALSLLSKASLITLPLVLVVYNLWRGRLRPFHLWPYFAVAAVTGWIGVHWQPTQKFTMLTDFSFFEKLGHAGLLIFFYAGKVIWPYPLSFVYSDWRPTIAPWVLIAVGGAWIFLSWVASVGGIGRFRVSSEARDLGVALTAYALLLLPVLGFFDIYYLRFSPASDHWQYHAFPIILFTVAFWGWRLVTSLRVRWALAIGLVAGLAVATLRHARAYQNEETVWRSVLALNPNNSLARNSLGVWLDKQGRREEGRAQYEAALASDPKDVEANTNLGSYYMEKGDLEQAEKLLQQAASGHEESAKALYNLGVLAGRSGRLVEAAEYYRRTIVAGPFLFDARNNLALVLMDLGRLEEAGKMFEESLRIKPDYGEMRFNYGLWLEKVGRKDEALQQFQRAARLLPDHPVIRTKLANPH